MNLETEQLRLKLIETQMALLHYQRAEVLQRLTLIDAGAAKETAPPGSSQGGDPSAAVSHHRV